LKISFVFVLVEKAFIFPISLSTWSHNTRLSWVCVSKPASKAQPDLRSILGVGLQIFFLLGQELWISAARALNCHFWGLFTAAKRGLD
jgi:hypothetical protein